MLIWLVPILYRELEMLVSMTPKYVASLGDMINGLFAKLHIDISVSSLKSQLAPKSEEIAGKLLDAIRVFLSSATGAISSIISIALIPIVTFYFLRDFDKMSANLFEILEKNGGKSYKQYLLDFDEILSKYFRGQIIVALILSALYTSILLISGVKPAILIGVVSGLLSVVPYLGFIIGFGTSIILAIVQYQDFLHPLLVFGGFVLVQAIEGNYITPKIVGESLGLHPTAVIFALMAGGTLFGIAGMILALPVAAFIKVLASEYLKGL
jgi:predicted PurR-regulated permease PerM